MSVKCLGKTILGRQFNPLQELRHLLDVIILTELLPSLKVLQFVLNPIYITRLYLNLSFFVFLNFPNVPTLYLILKHCAFYLTWAHLFSIPLKTTTVPHCGSNSIITNRVKPCFHSTVYIKALMLLNLLLGLQIICEKPVILIITMMIHCVHIQSPQSFHNKSSCSGWRTSWCYYGDLRQTRSCLQNTDWTVLPSTPKHIISSSQNSYMHQIILNTLYVFSWDILLLNFILNYVPSKISN